MPEINPLTNNQIFLKKIAENTGSDYETGDVSEINPLTIDQIFLKEIAANTAGQSEDISELEGKVADNTAAIKATQDIISDAYDSTHTYNVGDYCIHENVLYKCKTASTTGTWDSSKWDAISIVHEITELSHYAPECYRVYIGSQGQSKWLDCSTIATGTGEYGSSTILVSTSGDTEAIGMVGGAVVTCGHGGLRFVTYNSDTSVTFGIYGYNLIITAANEAIGQWAYIKVFKGSDYYKTGWPY